MMTSKIYTVHENATRDEPSERIELVREAFSFWAFVLSFFWLLGNKLWVPALIYLVLVVAAVQAQQRLGLDDATMGMLQFFVQLLLGFSGHDIQRWALDRRGYRLTNVVVADSELTATQRAYTYAVA